MLLCTLISLSEPPSSFLHKSEFVGSLRATGYDGHIILGVSKDLSPEILEYFKEMNVRTIYESANERSLHSSQTFLLFQPR